MSFGDANRLIVESPRLSLQTLAQGIGFGAFGYAAGRMFHILNLNPLHGFVYGGIHFTCQKLISQIFAKLSEDTHADSRNEMLSLCFQYVVPAVLSFGLTNYLLNGSLTVTAGVVMPFAFAFIAEPVTEYVIRGAIHILEDADTQETIGNMYAKVQDFFQGVYNKLPSFGRKND